MRFSRRSMRRPLPLAGIASAGVVVGGHAHLVGPENLRTLTKRLNFNGRVGLQQPLLHLVRVLLPPMPARLLGGIAPAPKILPHRSFGQVDAKLLLDELAHRTSGPQSVLDAQGLRRVVVNALLDALHLGIGQQASHAERSPRPVTGQRGRAGGGVSRPPAADGFMADPKHVGEFDFGVAQLDAAQGTWAQYLQRFMGQVACVRQFDRHGRSPFPGFAPHGLLSIFHAGVIMTGESTIHRPRDVRGQELSYAEVKAIASGNPAVLTLAEADAELERLSILKRNHADEQFLARRSLKQLPETIAELSKRLSELTCDMETASAHAGDPLTIGGRTCHRDEATRVLGERLDAIPQYVRETRRSPLFIFRGLQFGLVLHHEFPPDVYLEGDICRTSMLSRNTRGRGRS